MRPVVGRRRRRCKWHGNCFLCRAISPARLVHRLSTAAGSPLPCQVRRESVVCVWERRSDSMSSRSRKAMVCAIAMLCAMGSLAFALTSGTGTSGQAGTGTLGPGIGPGTPGPRMGTSLPGSPTEPSGTVLTEDTGPGSTRMAPGSATERPAMGVDRPGTEITEQPGGVSPGTETPRSATERPRGRAEQLHTATGSPLHRPRAESPMTGPSGPGSPGMEATGDSRR